ncbi:hypothetical protein EJ06DRAFT_137968 [Trichodelitschia bisporula]|uniref:CFEM domain-containing protein n=1 Tax=Trichodelitschia bisporula TaxID=703511 RepID=A0A6G1HNX7_9PEZI|nr:hypothetical protein EJ06DRAFT_137968 [Trichodelitschia bisporula]
MIFWRSSLMLGLLLGAVAQDVSSLPACGQFCVTNVGAQAVANANCNVNHANCYCSRYDFANKVKTCASTQCTSATDIAAVNSYADGYCADAGSGGGGGGGGGGGSTSSTSKSSSPSTSAATSSSKDPTAAPVSSVSSRSSPTPTPVPSGQSTGAKAGIGIGVALGVLAVAGILGALWWLRRRRQPAPHSEMPAAEPTVYHEVDGYQRPSEMEVKQPYPVPPLVHELPHEAPDTSPTGREAEGLPALLPVNGVPPRESPGT